MKKLYLIVFALQFVFVSCEKEHDFPCSVVVADEVPATVKNAFVAKYTKSIVDVKKWFNKDNTGYCAYFLLNNTKTLAHFNNDGTFIDEKISGKNKNHDDDDDDEGCECEIED